MRDVTQGLFLLILSILIMITYFWALFLAPSDITFLGKTISEWALIIPVLVVVYLFLFVVAWIGWAMVTTPPPLPATKGDSKKDEEEKRKEST